MIEQEAAERVYTYFLTDPEGTPVLSVLVALSPAGTHLTEADHASATRGLAPEVLARDFPDFGARARVEAPFFSPSGGLTGLVFTTSDLLFDVRVSVFEASSDVDRPALTALEAARIVEDAYLATFE